MYKNFVKELGYGTSDGIRIIIGESFNKLGLLMDLYYKSLILKPKKKNKLYNSMVVLSSLN